MPSESIHAPDADLMYLSVGDGGFVEIRSQKILVSPVVDAERTLCALFIPACYTLVRHTKIFAVLKM